MTATSISMQDSATKVFVVDVYAQGLVTNNQYEPCRGGQAANQLPAWQEHVIARLAELERMPPNWDSEGALPVSRHHANRAQAFLARVMSTASPAPEVVPLADGGVQLEWRLPDGGRLDFITDEEESDGAVLIEAKGELSTYIPREAIHEVRVRLGRVAPEH